MCSHSGNGATAQFSRGHRVLQKMCPQHPWGARRAQDLMRPTDRLRETLKNETLDAFLAADMA